MELQHVPVLLSETLDLLNLRAGTTVIDATLGLGGHSKAILEKIGPKGKLLAFEQDERNLKEAQTRLSSYKNVAFSHSNFEHLKARAYENGFKKVDAILFDIGLSSPHVDDPERGFSFMKEGPLDMRFDPRNPLTAAAVVNGYTEHKLGDIIKELGEEPWARKIAELIVEHRKKERFETTTQLANFLKEKIHTREKIHPATRTFQALRIYVNRELEVLENALHQAVELLKPGGRLVVLSYHSLEDRIVKNIFKYYTQSCICPSELPICQCQFTKKLYLLTKKPIIPSGIEVQANPRSRSAKLRAAERL